jgi:hypothetical protein
MKDEIGGACGTYEGEERVLVRKPEGERKGTTLKTLFCMVG